ncbi:MAG: Crp/Fnr family transcriptional regulator [Oscillatoriophycideae cyanobacterium NC_groundwater_1537_Pr4_S-0.65um_50_18]|nr:Crp/Fnr family transcriptional regulator [Oscillatoriophycideae cyanobacterium NC_groundwater_1537_Pr4_S-0.65um_50_18]
MLSQDLTQLIVILRSLITLPDDEAMKAASLFQACSLKRGEFFVQAGDVPKNIGIVMSGILRLYYVDHEGNEYTKSFCAENSFVAAYSSLLLEQPSRLFIQALEDTKLLTADYAAYRSLSESHPCWQILNCKIAEGLFIKKEKRESALLLDDAKTRYLNFQAEYPHLEPRLKQHHIASYLGITPVTLSRIRAQLRSH